MPNQISCLSNGKYQVKNRITGKIHTKGTTKDNAEKQLKLMEYLDAKNKKPPNIR